MSTDSGSIQTLKQESPLTVKDQWAHIGRGERIRTSGLYVPNVALYQAKLHPEVELIIVANPKARFRTAQSSGNSRAMLLRTQLLTPDAMLLAVHA